MNKWQLKATVYNDPILNHVGDLPVLNFTALHLDFTQEHGRRRLNKQIKIDCSYWEPPEEALELLQKGLVVYLEGEPYIRPIKRTRDGTEDKILAMDVWWARKWEKSRPNEPTDPSTGPDDPDEESREGRPA